LGKRSPDFIKKSRDYYPTIDPIAAEVLLEHLEEGTLFIEPCAGAGDLALSIFCKNKSIACVGMYDIEPQKEGIIKRDCLSLTENDNVFANRFITNPPFTWSVLQPLMGHMISLLPTWLLLPADVMHNVRMGPYMKKCVKVVSIGRMYWMENKIKGVENMCWYLFDKDHEGPTQFIGRLTK